MKEIIYLHNKLGALNSSLLLPLASIRRRKLDYRKILPFNRFFDFGNGYDEILQLLLRVFLSASFITRRVSRSRSENITATFVNDITHYTGRAAAGGLRRNF